MKIVGIYKITSPSGKVYIGQTRNYHKRVKGYTDGGCSKCQPAIYRSIKKYGASAHKNELVYELPNDVSQDILNTYEVFYIDQLKEGGVKLLNIRGGGGQIGKWSSESIEKMRIGNSGKKQSKETIEGRIKYIRGMKRPEGWCAGNKNPMYGTIGTRTGTFGELHPNAKLILDTQTGIFYFGCAEACRILGGQPKNLRRALKGEYKNYTSLIFV